MLGAQVDALRTMSWRKQVVQLTQVLSVIASALAMWKGLAVVTNAESPVVVVLSGSMEPAFHRGDLLLLTMTAKPIEVGEITVYRARGTDIPIVHRVIETHYSEKKHQQLLLTKGDNNSEDDLGLYNGPRWIKREDVVGRVRGYVAAVCRFLPQFRAVHRLRYDPPQRLPDAQICPLGRYGHHFAART